MVPVTQKWPIEKPSHSLKSGINAKGRKGNLMVFVLFCVLFLLLLLFLLVSAISKQIHVQVYKTDIFC